MGTASIVNPAVTKVETQEMRSRSTTSSPWSAWSLIASVSHDIRRSGLNYTSGTTPNYNQRIRKGELLPHTAYERLEWDFNYSGTHGHGSALQEYRYVNGWTVAYATEADRYSLSQAIAYLDTHANEYGQTNALQQCAAKANSAIFDLGTFVAEFASMRAMFTGIGKSIIKAIENTPPKLLAKNTSDLWLEARFGWRPLISDMKNLSEALSESLKKHEAVIQGFAAQGTSQSYDSQESAILTLGVGNTVERIRTFQCSTQTRASLQTKATINVIGVNPLITGWEVIPFSFVVDWFINVGQALGALSFIATNPDCRSSTGIYQVLDVTETVKQKTVPSGLITGPYINQTNTYRVIRKKRSPASINTMPHINYRLEGFKYLDLLALIIQKRGGKLDRNLRL
jgi:hypothetical protein